MVGRIDMKVGALDLGGGSSEKAFAFTEEQVRVILFRECDFRGRKLLFDSKSVEKVSLTPLTETHPSVRIPTGVANQFQEKYVEISNGYGYQYTKPCTDISQLGEMVFGSVAMSYRGTSLKIHSLMSPKRLMFSQIFPSLRHPSRSGSSAPGQMYSHNYSTSLQGLEQSVRLDDSGTSSANSISDRLSMHSTNSDTLLVCRDSPSQPLDVPIVNSSGLLDSYNQTPSVIGDSGFSGEQSYNSIGSGTQSLPIFSESEQLFSCGSLYKRWLRSTSTSLEPSPNLLTGSVSADECLIKTHPRSSKLGLAVIIELSSDQEKLLEQFIMEHAALLESMVWRTRQGAEIAYIRHNNFLSLMCEVTSNTAQWFADLLSGPQLSTHMWISIAPICDNLNSINSTDYVSDENCSSCSYSNKLYTSDKRTDSDKILTNSESSVSLNNSIHSDGTDSFDSSGTLDKSSDFTFLNLTKLLRNEWANSSLKNNFGCSDKKVYAEKYITELCELLETIDIKHTNFFISTLITAVLTYHLGWVTTVLPPSSTDRDKVFKLHNPCNPFWGQLSDLYGAIGHPTKVAHTIITGTNKPELISKLLNALTYFIRCSDTERKCLIRSDIKAENKKVDLICQQKCCIPKENYKKYEDHLREMEVCNNDVFKKCGDKQTNNKTNNKNKKHSIENIEMHTMKSTEKAFEKNDTTEISNLNVLKHENDSQQVKVLGLSKSRSCRDGLKDLAEEDDIISKQLYLNLSTLDSYEDNKDSTRVNNNDNKKTEFSSKIKEFKIQPESKSVPVTKELKLSNEVINEKVRKLCRVPASALLYHLESDKEQQQLLDIQQASKEIQKVYAPKKINMEIQTKSADSSFHLTDYSKPIGSAEAKECEPKNVVFVLGDNEELIGIKKENKSDFEICQDQSNKSLDKTCNILSTNLNDRFEKLDKIERPTFLNLEKLKNTVPSNFSEISEKHEDFFKNSKFKDSDFYKCQDTSNIKPSNSCTSLYKNISTTTSSETTLPSDYQQDVKHNVQQQEFSRSQSVPPETKTANSKPEKSETRTKFRYSGVKFNFQQYPQIVTNYMRSKNLELSQLPFVEKAMKLNDCPPYDFLKCETQLEEIETLQTPSNASELEFTSDLITEKYEKQQAKEAIERHPKVFTRTSLPNTVITEVDTTDDVDCGSYFKKTSVFDHPLKISDKSNNAMFEHEESNSSEDDYISDIKLQVNKMQIVELPMPKSQPVPLEGNSINYTSSLMRGIGERYISDMVLQGISTPKSSWESALRRDLSLATRHPLLDQPIDEAVAIVANIDTWEVQLLSSHTYVVDRGSSGVRVGMSQLVANMLESLLHMWKLRTPPEYCIMYIEHRLQEFCALSRALSELLLATEFCSMDLLTSVLQLEVNDVPLLMAVASTHSPQVTQKYGLSFQ